MTALELVTLVSQAIFGLLFVLVAIPAVRTPTRARIDTALFFGAFAAVILAGRIDDFLSPELARVVAMASGPAAMALPVLLLRLAADFVPVRARHLSAAVAGLALAAGAIVLIPPPLPPLVLVPIVGYFMVVALYASSLFARRALTASAVLRRRMQFISAGSALLGIAVLVAGAAVVVPGAAPAVAAGTQLLVLFSALSYAAGFAPPAALRRYWREPVLRGFITQAADLCRVPSMGDAVRGLEAMMSRATGTTASVGLLEPERGTIRWPTVLDKVGAPVEFPPEGSLSGAVLAARRPLYFDDALASTPTTAADVRASGFSVFAGAPVLAGEEPLGVLMLSIPAGPRFLADDLELLELLATQAGVVIESRRRLKSQETLTADASAAREAAERATEAKTEFLASMSHELRTPLNAVLGFSDLLREQLETAMNDRQLRYLANIRDAGEHLLGLINDILDLSKVEAGHVELKPEFVTLDDLAAPILASTRAAADAAGVTFDADSGGSAPVFMDLARARQVLYNLASNAVKFTPAGGRVVLRQWLDGDDLRIEVTDTGIGIPADRVDRVFGQFERVNEDRSQATGTGLGLALTKRVVELQRGAIDFESAAGRGSTFRVHFPDVAAARLTRGRLLIVEDERRDAELIIALAGEHGLPSEVVSSATAAVAAIERDPPLAVVLDLRLPDTRGEAVLRAVRRQATRIPIAVVTVEDDDGHSVRLGADMHLTKPIDRARLAQWLARVRALPEAESRLAG